MEWSLNLIPELKFSCISDKISLKAGSNFRTPSMHQTYWFSVMFL